MKAKRIEKLRNSKPIEITGNEITPSDDLKKYKKNALEYGKSLRGTYTNRDTGSKINLAVKGIKEVLEHDYKDVEHLQSIAAIPQIIEKSIYIDKEENEDKSKNIDVANYDYYVAGLKINGIDYTVKAIVANGTNGQRYYDHKLTPIEKEKLLDELDRITNPSSHQGVLNSVVSSGLSSMGDFGEAKSSHPATKEEETAINSPVSGYKDKRLISILQINSPKFFDNYA